MGLNRARARRWLAALATVLCLPLAGWTQVAGGTAAAAQVAGGTAAAAQVAGGTAAAAQVAGGTAAAVSVWLDGRQLALNPAPQIVDGRTLVPLRGVFEALGATVAWDGATSTVTASRPGYYARLVIGRRLACLSAACDQADLLDVPARITDGRTFVPLRFVATAMGVGVEWDGTRRAVQLSSAGAPPATRALTLTSVTPGQAATGPLNLAAQAPPTAAEVRYFLLDRATGRGPLLGIAPIAAAGPPPPRTWRPDPAYAGPRLLAAAAYDAGGRLVASHVVPVTVAPDPRVALAGVQAGQVVTGPLAMSADFGFVATYVKYTRADPATGAAVTLAEADPYAPFTWYPGVADNGDWTLLATAYDRTGKAYPAAGVAVSVRVEPSTTLSGVTAGQTITGPVTLRAAVNYPLERVQFSLADGTVLHDGPGATYRWFPGPDRNGPHTISTVVWGKDGVVRPANPVQVTVNMKPSLRLSGVGPRQVVTGKVTLTAEANVPLAGVEYLLLRPQTGEVFRVIAGGADPAAARSWTPAADQAGDWLLKAVGLGAGGLVAVESEAIPIRVYLGKIYPPVAVAPKDQFLALVSPLAVQSRQRTGMSAALQVAQAVLETGWGQSTPVDKYTGQPSNNLFGIKGTGPAGSVIHNTWEEYGGVAYRIDDSFRAYHNIGQSWQDHKDFLLLRDRYAGFRAVMTDPVLGAWALRRAGYATDSRYPIKLINIMSANGLFALDEMEP